MKSTLSPRCLALLTLAAIFFCSPASALDSKNRYLILGPGSYTCMHIISDLQEGTKKKDASASIIYSQWLAGNLTAYNRDTKNTYSILGNTQFNDAMVWAVNYCKEHPTDIFAAAADAYVRTMTPRRLRSMPAGK
jgi:hypothetical protein